MNANAGRLLSAAEILTVEHRPAQRWQASRAALRLRFYVYSVLLDALCILGCFAFAGAVYGAVSVERGLMVGFAILPIYLASAFGGGVYSVSMIDRASSGVARAARSLLFAATVVLFVAFYLRASEDFSRVLFAIGTIASAVALLVGRSILLRNARRIIGGNPYNVVVLSDGGPLPWSAHYSTVLSTSSFNPEQHDPLMYDRLAKVLRKVDRVIVACSDRQRRAWVHALQGANVEAEIVTPELAEFAPLGIGRFGADPTIVVAKGPLGIQERLLKRAFDVAVAGGALLLLLPVFALIALAIRLETRGPVFFVQRRIGRGNRMFNMLKFRSMRVEQCDGDGHTSTQRDDNRITRVGALLRGTSLDELPQLVNVLSGTMSIVGPRPHALGSRAEDQLFWDIDARYWHRHAAKPGLTGLAQVRGYRGATNFRADLVNRLQSDLEYLNRWTIWRDLLIVMQTFRVLVHKNAF